ncbi:MAG: formate dehydrogenase accessory protein FdhE [Hyphomicrobiaceae bacterium]|nr:formate dehydrogenase accessory protein FdhE [Hyphomicrobiaceae bacterium]
MPRDGSPPLPPGVTPAEPMSIGEIADPPFAILPDPARVFRARSERFAALARGHELETYLQFLSRVAAVQDAVQARTSAPALPADEALATAYAHAMPPISFGQIELGAAADEVLIAVVDELAKGEVNADTEAAVGRVRTATREARLAMMHAVLVDEVPAEAVAEHVLAAAALQVHLALLARQLDVDKLQRVADGACPACGGAPVTSMIVGWLGAHGSRFCTCSMCATHWNVSRIKCLVCGSEKGIAYHSLEGSDGVISGETCESCSSYVKMLHQHKSQHVDPVADDVATLALDLTLAREGWQRASVNAFLMGY